MKFLSLKIVAVLFAASGVLALLAGAVSFFDGVSKPTFAEGMPGLAVGGTLFFAGLGALVTFELISLALTCEEHLASIRQASGSANERAGALLSLATNTIEVSIKKANPS